MDQGVDGQMAVVAAITNTILMILAVNDDYTEIMKNLLEQYRDLDINYKDAKGKTAIYIAIERGNVAMSKCLIEYGADLGIRDQQGRTLLHAAVDGGKAELIDLLLTCNLLPPGLIDMQDRYVGIERCILLPANNNSYYIEVNRLYLHLFRANGDMNKNGATVDIAKYGTVITSGWGTHPSPEAESQKDDYYDVSKVSSSTPKDLTPLLYAILADKPQCALKLLQNNCRIDIPDCFGNSALHLACMRGMLDVAQELIRKGANLHATNRDGKKPIDAAQSNEHSVIVHLLGMYVIEQVEQVLGMDQTEQVSGDERLQVGHTSENHFDQASKVIIDSYFRNQNHLRL